MQKSIIFAHSLVHMLQLIDQSAKLIERTPVEFKRYLYHQIRWDQRLIGIKGARGTGKTTLLLQWLKEQDLMAHQGVYITLDDLYFSSNSLLDTAREFYRQGGQVLAIDEVHKYNNWSSEIKNCYDLLPDLKIIFTGSSIIDITRQEGDLSRRVLMYDLQGMSYREFLGIKKIVDLAPVPLEAMISNSSDFVKALPADIRPAAYFQQYLRSGYYPFALEDEESLHQRLNQLIRTIVEYDMAELPGFDIRNARKMLQLLYVIAQQVPFKPNISSLALKTGIHRNSLPNYLHYLDQAQLIRLIYPAGSSISILQKPEKLFLNNTNLLYTLATNEPEKGNVRETFFQSQLRVNHKVEMPLKGDFFVDDTYTFEVGGKKKSSSQLQGIGKSFVVRDDIDTPLLGIIPLWAFGLLY